MKRRTGLLVAGALVLTMVLGGCATDSEDGALRGDGQRWILAATTCAADLEAT